MSYEHGFIMTRHDAAGAAYPPDHFATRAFYDSANKFYDARLEKPGVFARHLWGANRTRGPREVGTGAVVLTNVDATLSTSLNDGVDGAAAFLWRWADGTPQVSHVFDGFAERVFVAEKTTTVYVRDGLHNLNQTCMPLLYAGNNVGTAGIEGTANDIKGQRKPQVLGTVLNVSPIPVNAAKSIYQVDGQQGLRTGWTMTARDKRAALTYAGTYASQADLENNAMAPVAGSYKVWPAGGCLRLGAALTGKLTCDVSNPFGGSNALGDVAQGLLLLLNSFYIQNPPYFATLPDVGLYLADDATYLDVLNQLWASVGAGWFIPGSYLVLQAKQLGVGTPAFTLTESDVLGEPRHVDSGDSDRGIPAWHVNVNYQRNFTVQNAAELAGVAASDIAFCERTYRTAFAEDASVKTQYARAIEITVDTLLADATAAAAEATRLLNLYKVQRDLITVEIPAVSTMQNGLGSITMELSDTVTFTYAPLGWGAGKNFQIVGLQFNCDRDSVTLTLWG